MRGGTVYLAAMKGKVYAVAREAGTLLWKIQAVADSEIDCDLAADGDVLFVTTRPARKAGESAVVAIALP